MTAPTYQYVDLPDASIVTTRALLTARENIRAAIEARAMICIYGQAGRGKSLAVNTSLRELAPKLTRRIQFRSRPSTRDLRHELFHALGLQGRPPGQPIEFDRLLRGALEATHVLVCDEVQWLNGEGFECFRYLWDEPATQIAIVFVGGAGAHTVLCREPMLSARIFIWQQFTRLMPDEVLDVVPLFPPVWEDADPGGITFADGQAAHGNFRAWAQLTAHMRTAVERTGCLRPDRDLRCAGCSAASRDHACHAPPGRRSGLRGRCRLHPRSLGCPCSAGRPRHLHPTPGTTSAAVLAAAVAAGASFQQLATGRPDGFVLSVGSLVLHDLARYTDGCAIYPVPAWARGFLHAAAQFARLTDAACLLAAPADRPALLR
ncbi:ATP-binding protein, partial [Streptomyces lavendulae]|uniref:ATP-binding protein n=1 Tax=Streptomyces lavendulae TaxID=1914 RepID=UPI0025551391